MIEMPALHSNDAATSCLPQESEGREQELTARLAGKHTEQAELAGRVADCQAKLETKLQDLRAVADAKQQVTPGPRISPVMALLN